MEKREIKFDFWNEKECRIMDWNEGRNKAAFAREDCIPMEYSGLKDIDGDDIREYDIVTILNTPDGRDPNVMVEIRAGMFGFMMKEEQEEPTFYPLARFVPKYVKRIGDYFNDPTLLDEAAQKAAHAAMYNIDGQ